MAPSNFVPAINDASDTYKGNNRSIMHFFPQNVGPINQNANF